MRWRQTDAPSGPGTPRRVLVVEDDPQSLWALSTLIRRQGYECRTASDGFEALVAAREFRPHLILMDLMMPVLDGREAIRRLKADRATGAIPICVMTAEGSRAVEREVKEAGCLRLFPKPLAWTSLSSFLGEQLH